MAVAREDLLPRVPRWLAVAAVGLAVVAISARTAGLVPPALLLAAALGAAVLVGTIADPRVGLGALAFAMVLSPEAGGIVYVRADDLIVGAAALGWLARQAVHREPLRDNPLLAPMVLLSAAGLAALSLAAATGHADPFTGEQVPFAVAALHWVKRVEYFLIAFLVAQSLRSRREVAVFAGLLIVASVVVAARGVTQIQAGAEPGFRLAAPFDTGEANTLGEYLMFVMALALGLLLNVRSIRLRLALAAVLALNGAAFLHTFSRGSYIGLAVVVLVAATLRDARLMIVVAALAFVLPAHLPPDVTARVETIPQEIGTLDTSDGGGNALLARIDSYRVAAERVSERPILGYGPGVVALARIESQYAREAIDGGLVGLALFLWFLGRAARLGREVLARARDRLGRGIGLGYLAGTAGMAVAGLGAIPFTTIRTMEAFCFATGLAVVLWRLQRGEEEVAPA
jgi:O-antigen ligase